MLYRINADARRFTASTRVQDAIAVGNGPIVYGMLMMVYCFKCRSDLCDLFSGEWSLAVAFNTTNAFLKEYGDAQKLLYSTGGGWLFW
jgi:hypothetical protein